MNIADWLAAASRQHPHAPALLTGARVDADYRTFASRSAAVGATLKHDYSIEPGMRVALFMTNCTQYLECLYAIWWIGAVAIPINAKLHGREAAWICDNAGASIALICDETRDVLAEAGDALPADMRLLSVDDAAYEAMRSGGRSSRTVDARTG